MNPLFIKECPLTQPRAFLDEYESFFAAKFMIKLAAVLNGLGYHLARLQSGDGRESDTDFLLIDAVNDP